MLAATAHAGAVTGFASPAASPGSPAPGTLEFDVDPSTGNVALVANNITVLSYDLESNANSYAGDFIPANWQLITAPDVNGHYLPTVLSHTTFDLNQFTLPGPANAYQLNGVYDLGNILPAGRTAQQYLDDIVDANDPNPASNGPSSYGIITGATLNAPVFVLAGTQTSSGPVSAGTLKTVTLAGRSPQAGGVAVLFEATVGGTFTDTNGTSSLADLESRTTKVDFPLPSTEGNTQTWDLTYDGSFSGLATVTFYYDPTYLPITLDQTQLAIEHYSDGQWVLLNGTVDPVAHTITVETPSFSPFALAVVPEPAMLAVITLAFVGLRRRRLQ